MMDDPDDLLARLERAAAEWQISMEAVRAQIGGEVDRMRREIASLRAGIEAMRQAEASAADEETSRELAEALEEAGRLRAELNSERARSVSRDQYEDLEAQYSAAAAERAEALEAVDRLRAELGGRREAAAPVGATAPGERIGVVSPVDAVGMVCAHDMGGRRVRMGDVLCEAGVITQAQLDDALAEQRRRPHARLGSVLVELGYAGAEVIARVVASQLGIPYVRLAEERIDASLAERLPQRLAEMHVCFPVRIEGDELVVAMSNPFDLVAIDDIEKAVGRRVTAAAATEDDIRDAIKTHYGAADASEGI